jgi:O-Antigen ligase
MRAALEHGARSVPDAAQDSRVLRVAPVILLGGLGLLTAAAVFRGGGSSDEPLAWIGTLALALACAAVAGAAVGFLPLPQVSRLGAWSLALLAAFVLWQGASVLWSIAPERSWDYFNRGLVYLAFAVAGLVAGTMCTRRHVAGAVAAIVAGVLVVALAGKVFPGLYPDGGRIARLRWPVGFWNALALLLALGVPLALWLTGEARRPAFRALGGVFLYGLGVGILLTYSRSGLLAGLLAIALWLGFAPRRLQSAAVLVVAGLAAGGVGLWAFDQPGLADDGQAHAIRVDDGAELGVLLVLGAAVVWAAVFGLLRWVPLDVRLRQPVLDRRRTIVAGAVVVAIISVVAVSAAGFVADQAGEFANPPTDLLTQDPGRLASVNSNNRWNWWQEAWTAFRETPVRGTGAGSFETTHRLLRDDPLTVTEPHSLPLQFLSETGIVGGLLAGGAAVAGLLAAVGAVRRAQGSERLATLALAVVLAVFAAHSLVDWDWDFVALGAPVFAVFGILLARGRSSGARLGPLWAAGALVALLVTISSIALPWLGERKTASAYDALAAGSPEDALAAAKDAQALNPVSIEPLLAQSLAATSLGDLAAARASLRDAVEVQPANAEAWYELGIFELDVAGRPDLAVAALERSSELDRYGPATAALARARESER